MTLHSGTEYDDLSGTWRAVYREIRDHNPQTGTATLHTVVWIDLGRPNRNGPSDPNALLAPERFPPTGRNQRAHDAIARKTKERDQCILERTTAYLREHGPTHIRELITVLGEPESTLRRHLHKWQGSHYQYHGPQSGVWGLVGQTYTRTPVLLPYVAQMRELLLAKGPLPMAELVAATGKSHATLSLALRRHSDIFTVVGQRRHGAARQPIYGLVGVHDQTQDEEMELELWP